MASQKPTPVVIGVGDIINRSTRLEDAIEPLELMLQAIQIAVQDTGLDFSASAQLRSNIDSIDIVRCWTWAYPDLPSLLSEKLGVEPKHKFYSAHSGNQPAKLFDNAARRISLGECKVAVVSGGEALASLSACAAAKKMPPPGWTRIDQSVNSVFSPTTRQLGENLGAIHSIGAPIHVYPLFENGFRAYRAQSLQENNQESARLYAEFARVAEQNPFAWNYGKTAETAESIGTTLLMNAFNNVNLAAACLLTSASYASELGIPESKWIYPLGGAGTRDSDEFWLRPNFHSSPALTRSLDAALEVSGLVKDNIDFYDFYSCFPIVPKLACHHLGLPITGGSKPTTLLGGLTSFGGAGNSYSMHALTALVRTLRSDHPNSTTKSSLSPSSSQPRNGLVLANGGVLTYQHVVILSTHSRPSSSPSYPDRNPLPETLAPSQIVPKISISAAGEGVIETYTVLFSRGSESTPSRPEQAYIVGRLLRDGSRFVANEGTRTR